MVPTSVTPLGDCNLPPPVARQGLISPHLPNICCFACYCFDQLYREETPESPFHLHFGLLMFLQGFCISSVNYVNHPLPVFVHWSVPLIVRDLADLKGQLQMGAHGSFLPALLTLLLLLSHPPRAFLCSPGNLCHPNWPLLPRALGKSSFTALSTFFSFASGAPHSCSSPHLSPRPARPPSKFFSEALSHRGPSLI